MKRIILMLSLVVMTAALLASPGTRAESIEQILNRYYACDSSYNYDMNNYPDTFGGDCRFEYYPLACISAPDPESCIEDYRATCIQNATSNHLTCVSGIESNREMQNFCDDAREIRNFCEAAYYATEDSAAFSACMLSSGISQCE